MSDVEFESRAPVKEIKPLASTKRRSVARSAGIVSLAVMASRVLGLVREMVFAYFFGASKSFANDAYWRRRAAPIRAARVALRIS